MVSNGSLVIGEVGREEVGRRDCGERGDVHINNTKYIACTIYM